MKLQNLTTTGEPPDKGGLYSPGHAQDLEYDLRVFGSSLQVAKDAIREIDSLPEEVREQVRNMARNIAIGVLDASKAIYDGLIDPEKLARLQAQRSDYRTDMERLDEFPNKEI